MRRPRLSYANVMSTIAVFVALGGSSYAAVKLGRGQVKSVNLASNSVTSAKVKDGSLLGKDFKAGALPAGAQGAAGPKGDPGPKGDQGPKGDNGTPLLRMTNRVEDTTVTSPQVVATIGGSANYSGAYSGSLKIPAFDLTRTYFGVIVTAAARFSAINGTSCVIQSSQNDGLSFTTDGSFGVSSSGSEFSGSGSAAIPVFTPGAVMRFQLVCQSAGSATLTDATIGVTAGSVVG